MPDIECRSCHQPVGDNACLCTTCTDRVMADLRCVEELAADLMVTRTKQDVISTKQARVSGTREKPLGYRPAAVAAAELLHDTLAVWTRAMAAQPAGPVNAASMALALMRRRETIRHHDESYVMLDELSYAVGWAREATDRPPGITYSGPCECGCELYAREGKSEIRCTECGARHGVEERRAWMLDVIRDHNATASEIAAGIGELHGQTINRKTINKWHSRDRLISRGLNAYGDPVFRIGDVLDLAIATTAKRHTPA